MSRSDVRVSFKITISEDLWFKLSYLMLGITRNFNEEKNWNEWTTSGWRMMSDESLRSILKELGVEVER